MKQIIIARKDLGMSPGKLAVQVSHASMAFLTTAIKENARKIDDGNNPFYRSEIEMSQELFEGWIGGSFTKVVCEAKNRNKLLKVIDTAEHLDLVEGKDFFLIKDNCYTELTPEEYDENGVGRCLTCIGFRPLPDEIAKIISKNYQLYK